MNANARSSGGTRRSSKRPPAPFLDEATRKAMGEQACALAKAVGYTSAGTVEFIVDGNRNFYFLEMNTRLQVEHPVTELITGVDLVEQMIRVANGEPLPFRKEDLKINGWAMESRLYAEDPYRNFLPSIGRLTRYRPPVEGKTDRGGIVRNDTGVYEGGEISMFYDPMIAKLCTWGKDRAHAIEEMRLALDTFEVEGIGHNLPFVGAVMDHPRFHQRQHHHRLHRRGIPRRLPGRHAGRRDPAPGGGGRGGDEPRRRNPPHQDFRHDGQPRTPGRRRLGGQPAGRKLPGADAGRSRRLDRPVRRWHRVAGGIRLDAGPAAGAAERRAGGDGDQGRQDPDGLPHAPARGRPEGACPHPAPACAGRADAGKGAAGYLEIPACARCRAWW
jgi:hypothetical protein